jgi:integrase
LRDLFGDGHYGTVKAHSDRWQAFVRWCRSDDGPGFNDARQIDRQTLMNYASHLRNQVELGALAIATAQNRLSSVNRTLEALRGDQGVRVPSPSKALGKRRTSVRTKIPQGQDRDQVKQIVSVLCKAGQLRAAAITKLARATGMRLREAILADIPRLTREARHIGRINIQDGTKGGRSGASAPRWVAVDDSILNALTSAQSVSPQGSKNLLFPDENYRDFLQGCVRPARKFLKYHGLKGFHELRAAYACERYKQITLRPAPINSENNFHLEKNQDREARKIISYELGHRRTDVVSSYIGGVA